jgi:hypothetical protein
MLVIGGYFITYEQLAHIGRRRGLVIEDGRTYILNQDLHRKGIHSIYAWPVDYPSGPSFPGVLICTRKRLDHLVRLADCQPFVEDERDLKVKLWLEINEITDAPFVAVPDPLYKYNEDGCDGWD